MSKLLNRQDLQKLLKVSSSGLTAMITDGRLPKPIELGERTNRWQESVIQQWIENGCPKQKQKQEEEGAAQ